MSSLGASERRSGALRCASWLTRRVTSRNSCARQAHVVLVGLRQELSKVGELPVDQPRVEDDRPCPENRLVGQQADRDLLDPVGGDDAAELAQRAGRDVRLELAADAWLQLGGLDREPVGVGGDHRHLLAAGADQDTGEHRPHVVARRGAGDHVHRLGHRRGRDRQRLLALGGKLREVLGREDPQVEAGAAAANLDVALRLAHLELDRVVAERAGELGEQAAGEQDRAGAVGLRLERRSAAPSRGRSPRGSPCRPRRPRSGCLRATGSRRGSIRHGRRRRVLRRARLVWCSASTDQYFLELD